MSYLDPPALSRVDQLLTEWLLVVARIRLQILPPLHHRQTLNDRIVHLLHRGPPVSIKRSKVSKMKPTNL